MSDPLFLSETQYERYARQLVLPEIGAGGQAALLRSRVLVVGAGGLGAPALLYLAAAGVGHIDVMDPDVVDRSNLHRQVIHRDAEVGHLKVESARRTLQALNPDVEVNVFPAYLTEENALERVEAADIVLDGCDNFPTRYLANDACFFRGKPFVHGAVAAFDGQATVFTPGRGDSPCYRCLFPDPPSPEAARPCRDIGVLGAVPGLVGTIQAAECMKLILGKGRTLVGRLLLIDMLNQKYREIRIHRDPRCALCGENPSLDRLADYEWHACESPPVPPQRT